MIVFLLAILAITAAIPVGKQAATLFNRKKNNTFAKWFYENLLTVYIFTRKEL